ncbi:MAG: TMEM43 family protein [Deltaproteobacteria bacterium]|nr:TMEM43 family protein [Deltaproteobacteria bacterium]
MDTHTEVTTTGWLSRIGNSIKSVLFGLLMFFGAFPLLWWNEGRAVKVAQSLDEGAGAVVAVGTDGVESENDGELVHVSGLARSEDLLRDVDFGVTRKGIKLIRSVEMYQWTESVERTRRKKTGGKEETRTTYRYKRSWSSEPIDSSGFTDAKGHGNPAMRFQQATRLAPNVTLGAFSLPPELVTQITGEAIVPLDEAALAKLTPALQQRTGVHEGAFHHRPTATAATFDAALPEIGDYRIRFSALEAAEVTIVAKQSGSSLRAYETKAGEDLLMLKMGSHSAEQMFASAVAQNVALTWGLRGGGLLLMLIGLGLVFRPIAVVADVVPLFGELLRIGAFFVALALALPLTILTIAIAWVVARPLIGAALLVAFVLLIAGLVLLVRKRRAKRAAVAATDPQFLRPSS